MLFSVLVTFENVSGRLNSPKWKLMMNSDACVSYLDLFCLSPTPSLYLFVRLWHRGKRTHRMECCFTNPRDEIFRVHLGKRPKIIIQIINAKKGDWTNLPTVTFIRLALDKWSGHTLTGWKQFRPDLFKMNLWVFRPEASVIRWPYKVSIMAASAWLCCMCNHTLAINPLLKLVML